MSCGRGRSRCGHGSASVGPTASFRIDPATNRVAARDAAASPHEQHARAVDRVRRHDPRQLFWEGFPRGQGGSLLVGISTSLIAVAIRLVVGLAAGWLGGC